VGWPPTGDVAARLERLHQGVCAPGDVEVASVDEVERDREAGVGFDPVEDFLAVHLRQVEV